ncbi:uncharacterized protein LOC126881585 [Diabrotica virgifera virgifera]|uniref:Uncharacterized protein LOC114337682 n=1 Tax=Diabrotica virgifera virgifera TaxID=50390 RepID=A0A6P7GJP0_DIAVI|nr:uncharacterized protein LOC126881585 [Diabrotica virgifera virgifera]
MKVTVIVSVLLCCLLGINSLIIPDELPSLLSVIYSSIPTLKKGTDSRLGWGFRLGNRADFQVLVELGPQKYTEPLGNQVPQEGNRKRNTLETLKDTLWAQNQELKRLKAELQKEERIAQRNKQKSQHNEVIKKSTNTVPNLDGANWLRSWSSSINKRQHPTPMKAKPGLGVGEIDAKSVFPEDEADTKERQAMDQARSHKTSATTSKADALDNVSLD